MTRTVIKYRVYRFSPLAILVLLFATLSVCFAQEPNFLKDTLLLTTDYLSDTTYQSIMDLEDEAYENGDLQKLRYLTEVHINKAKSESNVMELASGYYYRTIIEEPELAISYSDSIILVTAQSDHLDYPTFGYILKAIIYYDKGDYQLSLQNYITAYNLAVEKNNLNDQLTCSMAIAAIRNLNGQPHAAADIYTRSLKVLKKEKDFENTYYNDYMILMYNLALAHLRLSQLDSSRQYYKAGIDKALSNNDKMEYRDFVLVGAQLDYYEGDYQIARDTLLKYVFQLEGKSKAIKLYYLAKIAQYSGNNKQAITYFQQIDSIVGASREPFDNIKEVYQQLVMYYSLEENQKREIDAIEKLIFFDSLMTSEQKGIIEQATVAYDIPYLKRQKSKAEEQLKAKGIWIFVLGSMAGLAILIGVYLYIKAQKTRTKVKELLAGSKRPKPPSPKVEEYPTSVPKEIRDDILMKLEAFEKSDHYLSKELDMAQLAQEMDTNTSYLSTVINHYKEMSFPNYLKDLKITTAIDRLSSEPELLKYNYQGLADTFGFKTGESFSRAFYSKTGVYPSKVLKELKQRQIGRHL
ncbi:helix-turn-helix domain-containing protein [Arenibacter sp. F20364]|uniref:helix-turn-helix domain-containing protein n=1 Tax=Arenibacter sp. F20364 TaxID=2926415 RepID=UPI001FF4A74B|nr:helix-turn-helix domain-containing protein [Arenibacter sp. F20364]MCK0191767.1 helix-turn-helix domain-containing protein [Arenibacter sp. F20364]